MMDKWDARFLKLAKEVSTWSKDPSTQVGCVVVRGKKVVSLGFNGFPSGVIDNFRLDDRDQKLKIVVHAEANAIISAAQSLDECVAYVYPFMPCSNCASLLIQAGIKRVVSLKSSNPRWADNFLVSNKIFEEAGVSVQIMDEEEQCQQSSFLKKTELQQECSSVPSAK